MAVAVGRMKMDLDAARDLAKRGYLTLNTSGLGWMYGEINYGADRIWSCADHGHKTRRAALACADRQLRRITR